MEVICWGTRGSLPAAGPETQYYGGNTSCVEVRAEGYTLVLDAGSGIRRLGMSLRGKASRIDMLLTHLHMDHIQGMGFFQPLFEPNKEVHIYGPASSISSLQSRLNRYLSPPLFPVPLRDLPSRLFFHEVPCEPFELGPFMVSCAFVTHPGPTVGYRIAYGDKVLTYLPDHEPALVNGKLSLPGAWTSGYGLAYGVDLLIHDAQYTDEEYQRRVGWGHSTFAQAIEFARLAEARRLLLFHHDPAHTDDDLRNILEAQRALSDNSLPYDLAREGEVIVLSDVPTNT